MTDLEREMLDVLKLIHQCVVFNYGPEINLRKPEIIKLVQMINKVESKESGK